MEATHTTSYFLNRNRSKVLMGSNKWNNLKFIKFRSRCQWYLSTSLSSSSFKEMCMRREKWCKIKRFKWCNIKIICKYLSILFHIMWYSRNISKRRWCHTISNHRMMLLLLKIATVLLLTNSLISATKTTPTCSTHLKRLLKWTKTALKFNNNYSERKFKFFHKS